MSDLEYKLSLHQYYDTSAESLVFEFSRVTVVLSQNDKNNVEIILMTIIYYTRALYAAIQP